MLAEIRDRLAARAAEEKGPVRIAVASGHGVGKSALVAWLILWASATVPSTRGVVTANTETQLKTKTWTELGKWHGLVATHDFHELGATSLASRLPVPEGAGRIDLVPWSAHNAEAFAGLHNKGSRILIVFDEASAIAEVIWDTAEGALTDADTEIIWIAFGNPTRTAGRFLECFDRFRNRWTTQPGRFAHRLAHRQAAARALGRRLRRGLRFRARPRARPVPARRHHAVHRLRAGRGAP